ncbi:MAG: chemotaxis protein CheW [Candidatus Wallbacteria bacterium HGW-Wallbacteria-1]|jgi:purine-binding chemotaxis protein CheW|uniref:Chemotaxis protein CheW n=1 Tax=Candidatus Wallbacteria bacterium HGW-Wallbacteria-1 TaxID=2013854 RepID=A0A2N1PIY2_9BACT|nr:MAG: chemotaxis protein CheW [Candidatus Wallbacteria bacterium HGW-Wallbacteria-1]
MSAYENDELDIYITDEDDEDSMKDRFLTFSVGKEIYALEILYVLEIIGIQTITEVPDLPQYVKGVINLRGNVIPVMDVRLRFNLSAMEYHERTCIVVVDVEGVSVGLIVDSVAEVIHIPEEQQAAPPDLRKEKTSSFIKGMGKMKERVILLLDVNRLLYDDDRRICASISEAN